MAFEERHWAPAVVIDNGSHSIKAGIAGHSMPHLRVPSVVAQWERLPQFLTTDNLATEICYLGRAHYKYIGDNAKKMLRENEGKLYPTFPLCRGRVENWEDLESVSEKRT